MDSVPPLRRQVYELLLGQKDAFGSNAELTTPKVTEVLDLPTNTVRRTLEDLAAYHLVKRLAGMIGGDVMVVE